MMRRFAAVLPLLVLLTLFGAMAWTRARSTEGGVHLDPVCGMEIGGITRAEWGDEDYYFCTEMCRVEFLQNPSLYVGGARCPVCSEQGQPKAADPKIPMQWDGRLHHFCTTEHRALFAQDPGRYLLHKMWGLPNGLYYGSVGFVLLLTFVLLEGRPGKADTASLRFDLLRWKPLVRVLKHPMTRFAGRAITVTAFAMILLAGFWGHPSPSRNLAVVLTWTIWWGGLVWLVLFLGKAWCYVCPFDALADWTEGLRLWGRRTAGLGLQRPWPRALRSVWPAIVLFLALTWAEIGFGVTTRPAATATMALVMLALAIGCALVFDRRSFCRYGCLVGRISGLYALFSPIEVRARDTAACRECPGKECLKGGQGEPCPTFQYLGAMDQNTYCVSCMECVKSCPTDNVALKLRPWGEDLRDHSKARRDEAWLALMMLSLTGFHGLTMTGIWLDAQDSMNRWLPHIVGFSLGMAALALGPVALYAVFAWLGWRVAGDRQVHFADFFFRQAYALLPIALFYHLAHSSEHLLVEGTRIVPLLSDPLGHGWDLLGTASITIPPVLDLPSLWALQVLFVLIGHVFSLWVSSRVSHHMYADRAAAMRSQVPMLVAMILFSALSLWLLRQPMIMRSSAM